MAGQNYYSNRYMQAYAQQQTCEPSGLLKAAAWQFGSHGVYAANPEVPEHKELIDTVVRFCILQNIDNIPPIYIVDTKVPNAASVMGREIMFTTGLMKNMSKEQVAAVAGHELSHHRHNVRDTVAQLGLVYGGAEAGAYAWQKGLDYLHGNKMLPTGGKSLLLSSAARFVPVYLGAALAMTPYRHFMEYEADKEGAQLAGPENMAGALEQLQKTVKKLKKKHEEKPNDLKHKIVKTMLYPFSSHPETNKRIEAIRNMDPKEGLLERLEGAPQTNVMANTKENQFDRLEPEPQMDVTNR